MPKTNAPDGAAETRRRKIVQHKLRDLRHGEGEHQIKEQLEVALGAWARMLSRALAVVDHGIAVPPFVDRLVGHGITVPSCVDRAASQHATGRRARSRPV